MIVGIIIGVIVLTLLVAAHELGHALVAKHYGTKVEEFGLGFPPKVWGKTLKQSFLGKNVLFSINLLPLGGFVKMQGEHDDDKKPGDYGRMAFWQKSLTLLAGVIVNWLLAAVLLTLLAVIGLPKLLPNQFYVPSDAQITTQPVVLATVAEGLPAAKAGLETGDQILRFDGQAVESADALAALSANNKGETVKVIYSRNSVEHEAAVSLRADNADKRGYLGAGPSQQSQTIRSTWSAPLVGLCTTAQMTWVTLQGLGQMVVNGVSGLFMKLNPDQAVQKQADANLASVGNNVAGPLSIFGILFPAAEKAGPAYVILMAAIISLTLAVMNTLPFPALDGGRWFVTALYRLMKKPLTAEVEEKIHGIGFMFLMGLVILITIADIGKFNR